MAKTKGFASELKHISSTVDRDVGRVITLLRDDSGGTSAHGESVGTSPHRSDALADTGIVPPPTSESSRSIDARAQPTAYRAKDAVDSPQASLENVTTRLTRDTSLRLTEAALRQKLAKSKPDTRQDIIEAAVRGWLQDHAYISAED